MQIGINILGEFEFRMRFENGWAMTVYKLTCGHTGITVVPAWMHEEPDVAAKEIRKDAGFWSFGTMAARGDYIDHFKGTDAALLDIIQAVRARPTEPHLARTNAMIDQATS